MWNLVKGIIAAQAIWQSIRSMFAAKEKGGVKGLGIIALLEVGSLSMVGAMIFAGAIGALVGVHWLIVVLAALMIDHFISQQIKAVQSKMIAA